MQNVTHLQPSVTVIMPIRNEAGFIEQGLGSVLDQDYPAELIEVLVVDGMSDDTTREVIARTVVARPGAAPVMILDNPGRIVPTGMNLALARARGEVVVRVDGHCEIAPDYVRRCVEALEVTRAECVGGPMLTIGGSTTARAIALAQSSPFGVGGVAFRTGRSQGGFVDTVAFGAYRREVFERIGGFDEELVRNQDDELNFRLIQAGGKIWLDPAISSVYYSRASLRKLWRQYYQYGLYKVRVMQKRGGIASWRHLVPALFVLALIANVLLALFTRRPRLALGVAGPYAAANFGASLLTARHDPSTLLLLPAVFFTLHAAYGLGFLAGLWRWREHFGMRQSYGATRN